MTNKKEYMIEYYQLHKEKLDNLNSKYYQNHKEEITKYKAKWYQKNKEQVRKRRTEYYQKNKERILKQQHDYRAKHKEQILKQCSEYRKTNRKLLRKRQTEYRVTHRKQIRKRISKYFKTPKGKMVNKKQQARRKRRLGWFLMFDNPFDESVEIEHHHITDAFVVSIPKEFNHMYMGKHHREMTMDIVKQIYLKDLPKKSTCVLLRRCEI